MDKCFARRVHGPRLKPLASCLALALALSTGTVAASPARPLVDRPAISELLPNWKPSHTPIHRIERNAAIAMQYPALQPVPQRIPQVPAGSVPVTNCDDSGAGSLRDAIGTATSGQTIDLTATGCSTITLTTGDIFINQEDLTLQGPGSSFLTIDGNYLYSLRHSNVAGGTFGVYDLSGRERAQVSRLVIHHQRERRLSLFVRHDLDGQLGGQVLHLRNGQSCLLRGRRRDLCQERRGHEQQRGHPVGRREHRARPASVAPSSRRVGQSSPTAASA